MNIAIVGLGVIGGSFAMGLQVAGYKNVYGIDINKATLLTAIEQGIIKEGFLEPNDILKDMDIVMISLYPSQIVPFIEKYKSVLKDGAILTDVTGVKTAIIDDLSNILPSTVDFVFAHPMRGSEKKGIDGADHTRFIGANALLTPIPTNKETSLKMIEKIYKEVGFDQVTRVSPEKHDEQIAYVSQLIHVLSIAVVNSAQTPEDTMTFAGNSFQELTRIADINADLWSELFLNNRTALLKSITQFELQLDTMKETLERGDDQKLKHIFEEATSKRRQWY
jgi:prephenate dehydrogenase